MYSTEQEIDRAMSDWMQTKRFTEDATTNAAIRQRVEENLERLGGHPSIASFERAYLELRAENAVPEFRGSITDQPAAAPGSALTVEEYRKMRAADVVQRYRRDAGFKAGVDKLIAEGRI